MNKMFTATAILQLAAGGQSRVECPLGKYLTDYPNKNVASKVTIHHLLTHTGGTGDFFGPQFDAHRLELRALKDLRHALRQTRPGLRARALAGNNSNYGFLLLGLVIEKASGQDYYDHVRDHIYKPAGMTSSDSLPEDEVVPDRSFGYNERRQPEVAPNTTALPPRGTSAGGGYSTVEDLVRFATASPTTSF